MVTPSMGFLVDSSVTKPAKDPVCAKAVTAPNKAMAAVMMALRVGINVDIGLI
jgi:hypothetical protein